jgi:NAD(P)-dependent dehydrogenase (short-subunit alcohol dehydrogenase family)
LELLEMRLENKVALVTGAGRGLGRVTSILFAEEGAKIGAASKTKKYLDETVAMIKENGGEATGIVGDVSVAKDAEKMVCETVNKFGRLDILVNNAGIDTMGSVTTLSEEDWDRLIDINLKGPFLLSKYAIPEIIKTGSGSIVNIASTAGLVGVLGWTGYCASKGGVVNLTRAMALDLAPYKIRVNCVCPGDMKTPMYEEWLRKFKEEERPEKEKKVISFYPMGRLADPLEIAKAVLFFASAESSFATGSIVPIDAGYCAQ